MLSENQIKRLLKQAESASESKPDYDVWRGWVQALRLVLEKDTYPIQRGSINVQ